ncbi:hypothetical protein [Cellulomonas triticagri]|uniref:Sporulation protein n=1 Tax=Cellulomonas triticagri TaxID=2483352 RepID=A0A3M2JFB3_9CELL|nr:hypothetical protein [Cellulomonas triticagri]RMI08988.1 hypothetical protein EBM89_12160 [Cellulomonas triticagri]
MPDESRPDLAALTRAASEALSVRRVFGEPYEVDGTLVVPVGKVIGSYGLAAAAGGARLGLRRGQHHDPDAPADETSADDAAPEAPAPPHAPWHGHGHGPFGGARPAGRGTGQADSGGYAVRVKPLGVYVVPPDGKASWQPALDLNRVILGGQAVGAVVGVALALALALTRRRR